MNVKDWEIAHIGNPDITGCEEYRIQVVNQKTGKTAWGYVVVAQ